MDKSTFRNGQEKSLDPVYRHARREAMEILFVWAVALAWTVSYCAWAGYASEEPLSMYFGVPAWVFWGVVVPWGVCAIYSIFYSLVRMKNDRLGEGAASRADSDRVATEEQ